MWSPGKWTCVTSPTRTYRPTHEPIPGRGARRPASGTSRPRPSGWNSSGGGARRNSSASTCRRWRTRRVWLIGPRDTSFSGSTTRRTKSRGQTSTRARPRGRAIRTCSPGLRPGFGLALGSKHGSWSIPTAGWSSSMWLPPRTSRSASMGRRTCARERARPSWQSIRPGNAPSGLANSTGRSRFARMRRSITSTQPRWRRRAGNSSNGTRPKRATSRRGTT